MVEESGVVGAGAGREMILGEVAAALGNGGAMKFWTGVWVAERSLKERFPRLFHLSLNKIGTVREMGSWLDGRWRWEIGWRRGLLDREKPKEDELLELVSKVKLTEGEEDNWRWKGNAVGKMTVKEVYNEMLNESSGTGQDDNPVRIWKTTAPYKAQVMAWRLMLNKFLTCDKLGRFFEMPE